VQLRESEERRMVSRIHFISGLPRSGSTMLSAILKQNPRIHASVTSPLAMLCGVMQEAISGKNEFRSQFDDRRREALLNGVFASYYHELPQNKLIMDTNRAWTAKMALLAKLFPASRVICCVREVAWIIDSVERMLNKNPVQLSGMFRFKLTQSVYSRADTLMDSNSGLVGKAWSTLREAWFGEHATNLIVVRYETLTRNPKSTIHRLYFELKEELFDHDFSNLDFEEPEYDAHLGMPGLHTVRRKVEHVPRQACIPPDLFAKYADTAFWLKPELNLRSVTVI
jgi:sulfotransferase